MKDTMENKDTVGAISGYYDDKLSIAEVSESFLNNLGFRYDEFMQVTGGSFRKIFCGDNQTFLEPERFPLIKGVGEGQMLTKEGVALYVRMEKQDTQDESGRRMWVITAEIDQIQQSLKIVNNVIQSGMWYIDCDEKGQMYEVFWSHEFRKMLGYNDVLDFPNTLESWSDLLHPEDKERSIDFLKNVIADRTNKKKYNIEYRLKTKNNGYQWFRVSADTSRRADGTAKRMVGIFINIEKEKKAKHRIQRGIAFHNAYTESNLCEYYVNLDENTFESLKETDPLFGMLENNRMWDELIHEYIEHFVYEEDKDAVQGIYDRNYILRKFKEGKNELSLVSRILKDGRIRWVRNMIIPDATEENRCRYAMIFVRDITEAKKEEEDLKALNQENAARAKLIEGIVKLVDTFAIFEFDRDYYEFFNFDHNKNYESSGKYSDFMVKISDTYKAVADVESMKHYILPENIRKKIKTENDIYQFEYCNLDESVYKTVSFIPIEWNGNVLTKVLAISQNITEAKTLEKDSRRALKEAYESANRANEAKTEFLTNMSHDIRTPMNAIIGMTAIACANIDNKERVISCLSKITQSSRHLLGLINEVLDMARIESRRVALTEEEFNLPGLIDDVYSVIKPGIAEHHHKFDMEVMDVVHESVCGDSLRIRQILINILTNAIKYTPDNGIISFSLKEKITNHKGMGCYEFVVCDNGMGMSPEFQKVMFEPFTRADDKRTTKIQGTGLGMSITKNIIDMMNGHIDVQSELGKGSKFTVTIYLRLQNQEDDRLAELVDLPVLVVDDDKISGDNAVTILEDIGLKGEWVSSGEEAVAKTLKRHENSDDYFAIIIDWKMPGIDGVETARKIRKIAGKDVTIIILSAYDYTEIEEAARDAGVDGFIAKPLFRSRLAAKLRELISDEPGRKDQDQLQDISKCDYSGKKVLLVEDNELNSEIAKEIISMTGAQVETAENGKMAVDHMLSRPAGYYDMIFMDIQMPVMNGYEATKAIRSIDDGRGCNIPIIAMTANAFAEDIIKAKKAGMNEHMAKPIDINKLYEVLRHWLVND